MNSFVQSEIEAAGLGDLRMNPGSIALGRARLYHFFELALAHPGEEGFEYFRQTETENEFLEIFSEILEGDDVLRAKGLASAKTFFSMIRDISYEDVEAAHIGLFSVNYPNIPCPPYGSLYTAIDSDKRLEEMIAIKSFYHRNGVDIAESFKDLPDHLCVELEFSQLLCFRENEAATNGDAEVLGGIRSMQTEFLDKFALPLGSSLADLAAASKSENLYCALLETMRCFLLRHRQELGPAADFSSQDQEIQS